MPKSPHERGLRRERRSGPQHQPALADVDGVPLAAVYRATDSRLGAGAPAIVSHLEPTPTGVRVSTDGGVVEVPPAVAAGLAPGDGVRVDVAPESVRFVAAS